MLTAVQGEVAEALLHALPEAADLHEPGAHGEVDARAFRLMNNGKESAKSVWKYPAKKSRLFPVTFPFDYEMIELKEILSLWYQLLLFWINQCFHNNQAAEPAQRTDKGKDTYEKGIKETWNRMHRTCNSSSGGLCSRICTGKTKENLHQPLVCR